MFYKWKIWKSYICEKFWHNDLKVCCKFQFNLIEYIETNENLKKELKKFEVAFEEYEVIELWKHKK